MAASATDRSEEADDARSAVAFGHVNGIFVRKVPLTLIIYPDIVEQVTTSELCLRNRLEKEHDH